jgi:hypothetical protein
LNINGGYVLMLGQGLEGFNVDALHYSMFTQLQSTLPAVANTENVNSRCVWPRAALRFEMHDSF